MKRTRARATHFAMAATFLVASVLVATQQPPRPRCGCSWADRTLGSITTEGGSMTYEFVVEQTTTCAYPHGEGARLVHRLRR